jgi:hypothetical protein
MKIGKLVVGGLIGLLLTPVAGFLAMVSGGAGHGSYALAKIVFPYTMLAALSYGERITPALIVVALAQFPLYGLAVGYAALNNQGKFDGAVILGVHATMVLCCFK